MPQWMPRLTAMALAALLMPMAVWSNQSGTSTAQFLRIGQGTRAEGMGGAFTALANDAHALYWNPAGLAQISRRQIAVDHLEFIESITSQYAAFVLPFNQMGGSLGVGLTYVDLGSIERRDATGAPESGDNDVNAYAATLSWGQAIGDRMAIGAGLKNFKQNLADVGKAGVAGDIGVIYYVTPNKFALGASATNIGPKIKTGTIDEDLPLTYRGGGAYFILPGSLVVTADVEKEKNTDAILHGGVEYIYQNRFIARGGYQDTKEAGGGISAGLGFIWRPSTVDRDFFGRQDKVYENESGVDVRFDYGFVDLGDFDSTHRIGITFTF